MKLQTVNWWQTLEALPFSWRRLLITTMESKKTEPRYGKTYFLKRVYCKEWHVCLIGSRWIYTQIEKVEGQIARGYNLAMWPEKWQQSTNGKSIIRHIPKLAWWKQRPHQEVNYFLILKLISKQTLWQHLVTTWGRTHWSNGPNYPNKLCDCHTNKGGKLGGVLGLRVAADKKEKRKELKMDKRFWVTRVSHIDSDSDRRRRTKQQRWRCKWWESQIRWKVLDH